MKELYLILPSELLKIMKNKLKVILSLIGIIILISAIDPIVASTKVSTFELDNNEFVEINNITLKDDAFHKTYNRFHVETWYFDAIFDNNYSMAFWVTVVQKGNFAIASIALNIYENTNRFEQRSELNPFKKFFGSEDKPILKICDKTIITGDIDNITNRWIYNISFAHDNKAVNLQYTSITKGWRVDIRGGWWLVIPRLNVTGTITINGQEISVSGEGYHDHNWLYTFTPLLQRGWHFGRIVGDTLCVTWVKVMKNRFTGEIIAVLNKGLTDPLMLNPNDFKLRITEYMYNNRRFVPKKFFIEIKNDLLYVEVNMETLNIHHCRLPTLNYWKYHLKTVGKIAFDNVIENVNKIEISDLMKFF